MAAGYWDVDGTWREGDDTYAPPPTITPPPTTVSPPPTTVSPPPTTVSPPPTTVSPPPTTGSPPPPGSTGGGYWDIDGTWREPDDSFNPSASALSYVMPDGTVVRIGGGGYSPVALSVLSSIGRSPVVAEGLSGSAGTAGTYGTSGTSAFSVPMDQTQQGLGSSRESRSEEPQSLTAPTVTPTLDTIDFMSSAFEMPKTFSTPPSTGILGVANNRSRR